MTRQAAPALAMRAAPWFVPALAMRAAPWFVPALARRAAPWFVPALAICAMPSPVWACVGCVSSAFGDRTYGWPYLTLTAAPFLIGMGIAATLAYCYRARRGRATAGRAPEAGGTAGDHAGAPPGTRMMSGALDPDPRSLDKERT
jgi:hypothetical protein